MSKFKEILLLTIGTSPQIITEILYYYHHEYYKNQRSFDEIKIFTTDAGRKLIINKIIGKNGKLCEMEKSIGLALGTIIINENDIIVYKDDKGKALKDTRKTSDSLDAVNIMFNTMRKYSFDSETRITACFSGGRKSMSSGFTVAFQLLGRKQDNLIHIMPPDKKMRDKSWYYPNKPENKNEKIDVSEMTTLRIGRYIPIDSTKGSYEDICNKVQNYVYDCSQISGMIVNKNNFLSNDEKIEIPAIHASYIRYFLKKRIASNCNDSCNGCIDCFSSYDELCNELAVDKSDGGNIGMITKEHEICTGKNNGRYMQIKNDRRCDPSELNDRAREHIHKTKNYIKKVNISRQFKNTITIKDLRLSNNPVNGINQGSSKFFGIAIQRHIIKIEK
tara:strand:- start:3085 stop:4254 length:1170 start_codon:yes stop_codon:yes gene_type:complete